MAVIFKEVVWDMEDATTAAPRPGRHTLEASEHGGDRPPGGDGKTEGAAAVAARYGPEPEPEAPPPPDDERIRQADEAFDAEVGAEPPGTPPPPEAPPEPESPPAPDLASWKQQDYAQMDHAQEVAQAASEPEAPPAPDLASWKQQDYAQMAHAQEVAQAASEPWWQKARDWTVDHIGKIVSLGKSGLKARRVRKLKFNRLEDGHISVRAETPPGTRLDYRQLVADEGFPFKGTRYNPETVAGITSKGLLRGAVSKGSLVFAGLVSLGTNLLEFGQGKQFGSEEYWDATVKNRKFWVSVGVDFAVSVAVGVAAAALVGEVIIPLAALVGVSVPVWVAVAATAVVGTVIGLGLGDIPNKAKNWLNSLFP